MLAWYESQSNLGQKKICTTGIEMSVTIPELVNIRKNRNGVAERLPIYNPDSDKPEDCGFIIHYDSGNLPNTFKYVEKTVFGGPLTVFMK